MTVGCTDRQVGTEERMSALAHFTLHKFVKQNQNATDLKHVYLESACWITCKLGIFVNVTQFLKIKL